MNKNSNKTKRQDLLFSYLNKMRPESKHLFRIFASVLILSLFTLITFEAIHNGHEQHCQEENCPVCLVLQIIKNNPKKNDAKTNSDIVLHFIFENLIISLFTLYFISLTPVTKKNKLTI